jgi:ankyrin repeat protein
MMLPKCKFTKIFGLMALLLVILHLTGCATMTPLTAAAKEGDLTLINKLLYEGAKIDEPSSGKWGGTPLYWSLFDCKYEAAELLLAKGANVNLTDSFGSAPLYMAVCCENVDPSLIEHLIQKGADINYRNKSDGWTSLHYAISSRSDDVARLLIEKGANVNALADDGTTPLILAVKTDSVFIAKLLLEKGADVDWSDFHKKNAMSYAKGLFSKKKKMIQLLQNADSIRSGNKKE